MDNPDVMDWRFTTPPQTQQQQPAALNPGRIRTFDEFAEGENVELHRVFNPWDFTQRLPGDFPSHMDMETDTPAATVQRDIATQQGDAFQQRQISWPRFLLRSAAIGTVIITVLSTAMLITACRGASKFGQYAYRNRRQFRETCTAVVQSSCSSAKRRLITITSELPLPQPLRRRFEPVSPPSRRRPRSPRHIAYPYNHSEDEMQAMQIDAPSSNDYMMSGALQDPTMMDIDNPHYNPFYVRLVSDVENLDAGIRDITPPSPDHSFPPSVQDEVDSYNDLDDLPQIITKQSRNEPTRKSFVSFAHNPQTYTIVRPLSADADSYVSITPGTLIKLPPTAMGRFDEVPSRNPSLSSNGSATSQGFHTSKDSSISKDSSVCKDSFTSTDSRTCKDSSTCKDSFTSTDSHTSRDSSTSTDSFTTKNSSKLRDSLRSGRVPSRKSNTTKSKVLYELSRRYELVEPPPSMACIQLRKSRENYKMSITDDRSFVATSLEKGLEQPNSLFPSISLDESVIRPSLKKSVMFFTSPKTGRPVTCTKKFISGEPMDFPASSSPSNPADLPSDISTMVREPELIENITSTAEENSTSMVAANISLPTEDTLTITPEANITSTADGALPSTAEENSTSMVEANISLPTEDTLTITPEANITSTADGALPSTAEENSTSMVEANISLPTEDTLTITPEANITSTADGALPSTAEVSTIEDPVTLIMETNVSSTAEEHLTQAMEPDIPTRVEEDMVIEDDLTSIMDTNISSTAEEYLIRNPEPGVQMGIEEEMIFPVEDGAPSSLDNAAQSENESNVHAHPTVDHSSDSTAETNVRTARRISRSSRNKSAERRITRSMTRSIASSSNSKSRNQDLARSSRKSSKVSVPAANSKAITHQFTELNVAERRHSGRTSSRQLKQEEKIRVELAANEAAEKARMEKEKLEEKVRIEKEAEERAREAEEEARRAKGEEARRAKEDAEEEARRAKEEAEEEARRAKEEAEEEARRAKEEAEEEARIAFEAAEEEARKVVEAAKEAGRLKAEEEEKVRKEKEHEELQKQGVRRMPKEKVIQPLSAEWEARVKAALDTPNMQTVLITLPSGTNLTRKDLGTVKVVPGRDPAHGWLNDEIILAALQQVVDYGLRKSGHQAGQTPTYHVFNTFFYKNLREKGAESVKRWATKAKIGGKALEKVERIFIPVHQGAHWTLLVVSPLGRTIEYFDSMGGHADQYIRNAKRWLEMEMGRGWKEEEWTMPTGARGAGPRQTNTSDCGVFTCTTARMVAMGVDPMAYGGEDMETQRGRLVAELLYGGLVGDFEPSAVF